MFDEKRRLLICNARYGALYDLQPQQLRPGVSLTSIIAARIANGFFAGGNPQRYFEEQTSPAVEASAKLHNLSD